jgi:hypothetical protein
MNCQSARPQHMPSRIQIASSKRGIKVEERKIHFKTESYLIFEHSKGFMQNAVMITHLTGFRFCHDCKTHSKDLEGMCSDW